MSSPLGFFGATFYAFYAFSSKKKTHIPFALSNSRFFWLRSKLSEMDHQNVLNDFYKFKPLSVYNADPQQLSSLISNLDQCGYSPDGLLFFNRCTQYVLGTTPLVCWVGKEKVFEILVEGTANNIKEVDMT